MRKPLFSVVIPTFNRAEALKRCLISLVKQTYDDFEVIICDDGSNDHTKTIVEEFKNQLRLKYEWNTNWGGPARPRNNGIKNSSGNWICFLDSDDLWYPDKLMTISKYIGKYDVIYHPLDMYCNGRKIKNKLRQLKEDAFLDLIVNGNTIPNSSACVKKELLEMVGNVSEDRKCIAIEDYDLWLKLGRITHRFFLINIPLGEYCVSDKGDNISLVESDKLFIREMYVFKKHSSALSQHEKNKCESRICHYVAYNSKLLGNYDNAAKYYKKSIIKYPLKCYGNVNVLVRMICNYIMCKVKGYFKDGI